MHHIYHTPAIILSGHDSAEADKSLVLLTRELGLIRAVAGGVRTMPSKLRYVLTTFSHIETSLVRGKRTWRITTATEEGSLARDTATYPHAATALSRALSLMKRLVPLEERDPELFELAFSAGTFAASGDVSVDEAAGFERLVVARLLSRLGYLSSDPSWNHLLGDTTFSIELCKEAGAHALLLRDINRALSDSSL